MGIMGIYGVVWPLWMFMGIFLSIYECHGCLKRSMGIYGCLQVLMGIYECS